MFTLEKASAVQVGAKKVYGYLGDNTKSRPVLTITGNFNNTHFRMMDAGNREVAIVRRKKFSLKNMLTDQDSYEVTIMQGSPALLCMIVVALDEIYED